jgi:hypothetical protein
MLHVEGATRDSTLEECPPGSMTFRTLAKVVVGVCFAVALTGLVAEAVLEIRKGNGAGVYFNVYGQQIHWTSVIVIVGTTAVALLVAVILRWWQRRG